MLVGEVVWGLEGALGLKVKRGLKVKQTFSSHPKTSLTVSANQAFSLK